jgi:hypothetical protein
VGLCPFPLALVSDGCRPLGAVLPGQVPPQRPGDGHVPPTLAQRVPCGRGRHRWRTGGAAERGPANEGRRYPRAGRPPPPGVHAFGRRLTLEAAAKTSMLGRPPRAQSTLSAAVERSWRARSRQPRALASAFSKAARIREPRRLNPSSAMNSSNSSSSVRSSVSLHSQWMTDTSSPSLYSVMG